MRNEREGNRLRSKWWWDCEQYRIAYFTQPPSHISDDSPLFPIAHTTELPKTTKILTSNGVYYHYYLK